MASRYMAIADEPLLLAGHTHVSGVNDLARFSGVRTPGVAKTDVAGPTRRNR